MSRSIVAILALSITCSLSAGCSRDSCAVDSTGTECIKTDMGTAGLLAIAPRRLNIKGDMVVVNMSDKVSASDSVKITQLGAMDLDLGKLGTGMLSVPGAMLKAKQFTPGKANLIIGTNTPESIRFYLMPNYVKSTPDISTGTEVPLSVGILADKKLASLLNDGVSSPPVHYAEYDYQTRQQKFSGATSYPLLALGSATSQKKFVGFPNAYAPMKDTIDLRSCTIGTDVCNEKHTGKAALMDISVDRKGSLLGAILDKQLIALFIDRSFDDLTYSTAVSGVSSPQVLSSGDVNSDELADLVVWDSITKSISVFTQANSGSTPGFTKDADLSGQLNAAMGVDQPTRLFINDVDGDDWQDLVYITTNQIVWVVNQGPSIDGKVKFMQGGKQSIPNGSIDFLAVGDVDTDNKNDIVIASKSDKNLKVYINQASY